MCIYDICVKFTPSFIKYCEKCPGVDKCQKSNPLFCTKITYKNGFVDREVSPCKKLFKRIQFQNQFLIRDFEDDYLDVKLKDVDAGKAKDTGTGGEANENSEAVTIFWFSSATNTTGTVDSEDAFKALKKKDAKVVKITEAKYQAKLAERISALLGNIEVDPARIAMEVAVFADRASIDEEIVRLGSHIHAMRELFEGTEPAGRKLDFIVQEMNREFNTIGSKANDGVLTDLVIRGKAEIEKIREQVQNIE